MKYVFLLDGALVKKKLHCLIFLFAKGFVVSKTIFKGIINFLMQLKFVLTHRIFLEKTYNANILY